MPLTRCTDQGKTSLKEFYRGLIPGPSDDLPDIGTSMLKVIDTIDKLFIATKIYGLTSISTLNLLAKDDVSSPWYVSIVTVEDQFLISSRTKEEGHPANNEKEKLSTRSIEEFEILLVESMIISGGWPDIMELKNIHARLTDQ